MTAAEQKQLVERIACLEARQWEGRCYQIKVLSDAWADVVTAADAVVVAQTAWAFACGADEPEISRTWRADGVANMIAASVAVLAAVAVHHAAWEGDDVDSDVIVYALNEADDTKAAYAKWAAAYAVYISKLPAWWL